jgi:UDP-3-O-[3-hydroxymyristoyl] glucosamine N-acyltransferase
MKLSQGVTLAEIARNVGGRVVGNPGCVVDRLTSPRDADGEAICILWDAKLSEMPGDEALIIAPAPFFLGERNGVIVDDPKAALPEILLFFESLSVADDVRKGVHPSSVVSPKASVHPDAWIGPLCSIGDGTIVESGARLLSHVSVGASCRIGSGTIVEPHVGIMDRCSVGTGSLIHGGTVIGADGFGFRTGPDGPRKIPQLGGVVIGNSVEIGACTTIDRGTIADTEIGDGTKIDDHVHIGHNTVVGKNCIVVAMTGVAGSVVVEDNVVLAARSGVTDHVRIGRGAQVAGMAGVTKDVPAGATVSGFPAREHRRTFRIFALTEKLPELFERVRRLERVSQSKHTTSEDPGGETAGR